MRKAKITIELIKKNNRILIKTYDSTTPKDLLNIVSGFIYNEAIFEASLPLLSKLVTIVQLVEYNTDEEIEPIYYDE